MPDAFIIPAAIAQEIIGSLFLQTPRGPRQPASIAALLCTGLLWLASSTVSDTTYAQEPAVLQLPQARARAMASNPGLAQMQERYAALTHVAPQAASLPDPELSFNAMNLPWDDLDTGQEPMTQLQVGVSQQFPFPGKLALREDIALFEAQAALYSVDEMRLNLDMNLTVTWWEIFYLDRALDTVLQNEAVYRQLVDVSNARYAAGEGLQQDVLLAQLALSRQFDTNIQLQAMRTQRAIRLNVLMDNAPDTPVTLPSQMPDFDGTIAPQAVLYRRAEAGRPALQRDEAEIEASRSRLALAEKAYYPDFKLGVAYGNREEDELGQSRQDFLSVMFSVNLPLYAATRQSQAVKQYTRELARSRYGLLDAKNAVFSSIAEAVTAYRQAREQVALYRSGIVPQARLTVSSMLAGYQSGQVDFSTLVRSQTELLNAELLYWKAFVEVHQSIARLRAAVGEENIHE